MSTSSSSESLPAVLTRLVDARRVLLIAPTHGRSAALAADAVGERGSVVVLAADESVAAVRADAEAARGRVEIVAGDPAGSLPQLRTDDDTTFGVVSADVSRAGAAEAVQYLEWALVLGRPGTAVVVTGDADGATWTAVQDMVDGHPRLAAASWTAGTAVIVAAVTDQP
ncbi:hypothetical protein HQ308_02335 [Rhodococcus sp. BP-241]|uniref:hypothetical protein n=1 Tax=Rhodococcus sp. BP-241 TaxID=2739441 RepID=UPI001C9A83CF|nr:hypothetical protein [Rhodococcus sp. BP-241]MBY6705636.1 hypothetical protein [Rhodococcus sp. BP-241]